MRHIECKPPRPVHELALITDLVEVVLENREGRHVHAVRLIVGALSGVSAEALRFSFDVCTEGTALEDTALEIIETTGAELELKEIEVSRCA